VPLPLFSTTDDPGPDFSGLIRRLHVGVPAGPAAGTGMSPTANAPGEFRHGTTVVALRYADGIVMAGDRRATEGHAIAHRSMEKVFPADRYSAVAIAGAAGPAVEMVRLFQTQLEHYEKVEGVVLSLEGKANQLGIMVRDHLPLAMQGLAVVPLFAGFDLARGTGRIFTYDVTGGHYEETEHNATGSGGRDARTTIKLGYRMGMARDDAVELAIEALYEAADEDSVATVTADGFASVDEAEVAERFAALIERRRAEGHQP
jgi:proteasome beta subunit